MSVLAVADPKLYWQQRAGETTLRAYYAASTHLEQSLSLCDLVHQLQLNGPHQALKRLPESRLKAAGIIQNNESQY